MTEIKEDLKVDSHSKWDKIRRGFYKAGQYATVALATLGVVDTSKYLMSSDDKPKEPIENVEGYRRTVDFQVDTLEQQGDCAAYFSSGTNSITENYVLGNDNTYNQSSSILAHEAKHRDNHFSKLKNMPMSLDENYKVCCHDEISATIAELLQIRQEYLNNPTEEHLAQLEKENTLLR